MPDCFVCRRPATHIEASCAMRHTITANGREFHQVEERKRYFCGDHHGDTAIEIVRNHPVSTYSWPDIVVSDWHLEQCNCGVICYVPDSLRGPGEQEAPPTSDAPASTG